MPRNRHKHQRVLPGIYLIPNGYRVKVRVGRLQAEAFFPLETLRRTMRQWQEEKRVDLRARQPAANRGTLAADAERYLKLPEIMNMPSARSRRGDLQTWLPRFGHRRRDSLTPVEIQELLGEWRANNVAGSTLNHRRTALIDLYRRLGGRDAPNPAKKVHRYRQPPAGIRALTDEAVAEILAAMPDTKTRARLAVIGFTGLPHVRLMRLRPEDIDWEQRLVRLAGRRKGRGTPDDILPLCDEAVNALKRFRDLNCWGAFSTSSMRKSFLLAVDKVNKQRECEGRPKLLTDVRPYDLRHTFGSKVYRETGDVLVTAHLMGHTDLKSTRRYVNGAVLLRSRTALSRLRWPKAANKRNQVQPELTPRLQPRCIVGDAHCAPATSSTNRRDLGETADP